MSSYGTAQKNNKLKIVIKNGSEDFVNRMKKYLDSQKTDRYYEQIEENHFVLKRRKKED